MNVLNELLLLDSCFKLYVLYSVILVLNYPKV
jgi:hypothetical protein